MLTQKEIDTLAAALRAQGLTWNQTNFAVSLVRNAVSAEAERCASMAENYDLGTPDGHAIARCIRGA